jgi:hypothetical protein
MTRPLPDGRSSRSTGGDDAAPAPMRKKRLFCFAKIPDDLPAQPRFRLPSSMAGAAASSPFRASVSPHTCFAAASSCSSSASSSSASSSASSSPILSHSDPRLSAMPPHRLSAFSPKPHQLPLRYRPVVGHWQQRIERATDEHARLTFMTTAHTNARSRLAGSDRRSASTLGPFFCKKRGKFLCPSNVASGAFSQ